MSDPTTKLQLETLLRSGVAAARAGNHRAAREIFLAMSSLYPADVRVWLGLAEVAVDDAEQRKALEAVLALDPQHDQARQRLALLVPPPEVLPPPLTPVLVAPPVEPPAQPPTPHFPLLNRLALGIVALLLLAIVLLFVFNRWAGEPATTASLPPPSPVLQVTPSLQPTDLPLDPTDLPLQSTSSPTRPPLPPTLPAPSPQPLTSLPLGMVLEADGWSATLLRPDYTLLLDSNIGDLQPEGRFVLVLMAVTNNSDTARTIPAELFTLVDGRGRQFSPIPNASTSYLNLYPRGQYGDLALEESLTAHSGMRSIPIIFDVPRDATNLTLMVRGGGALGWPIEQPTPPAINVGP